jgi:hypothetical protein
MPSLLKAVARAHSWYEELVSGKMKCQRSIAKQTGFDECYIARILPCEFLAPDIVEAILAGQQQAGGIGDRATRCSPCRVPGQSKSDRIHGYRRQVPRRGRSPICQLGPLAASSCGNRQAAILREIPTRNRKPARKVLVMGGLMNCGSFLPFQQLRPRLP